MLLIRSMQINTIEAADRECEDELDEAEDGVRDVGEGHFEAFEEAHFCGVACLSSCLLSH
jgi:hypothetical protein